VAALFVIVVLLLYVTGLRDFKLAVPLAVGFAIGSYEAGEDLVLWTSRARLPLPAER
jgi:hypothetical protein